MPSVTDEPLYGHYLLRDRPRPSGARRGDQGAARPTGARWRRTLTGPVPAGKRVWYQKHMTHHLLPEIGRDWLDQLTNCFLIRDPREVLASYVRTRRSPTLDDLGSPQQVETSSSVRARSGRVPPVLDARDVLEDPRRMLGLLCAAIGIPFSLAHAGLARGPAPERRRLGRHWYAGVWRSTGFRPYRPPVAPLPAALEPLAAACEPYYRLLHAHRLGA